MTARLTAIEASGVTIHSYGAPGTKSGERSQTIESGVDGADGNFPLRSRLNLASQGKAIGLVPKTQNRQKNYIFEFAKVVAATH